MELFENIADPHRNLLPQDGTVNYYGKILEEEKAHQFYSQLLNEIEWRNDEAVIFGKKIITKRKVAWYGDENFEYTYSNSTKKALKWTPELLELKKLTEEITGEQFNSCLLNLYHDGNEGMAYHSDGEKDLKKKWRNCQFKFRGGKKIFLQTQIHERKGRACFSQRKSFGYERSNAKFLASPITAHQKNFYTKN